MKKYPLTNLLPKEILAQKKFYRWLNILKRMMTGLTGLILILVLYNCAHIALNFFTPAAVSEALKTEYENAQRNYERLQVKNRTLETWEKEKSPAVFLVHSLAALKPAGINFTSLEVSGNIQIQGFGSDASEFNSFTEKINQSKLFGGAQLEKIGSVSEGKLKTFSIKLVANPK